MSRPVGLQKRSAPTVTKDGNLSITSDGSSANNTDHVLGGNDATAAQYGCHIFAVLSCNNYDEAVLVNSVTLLCDAEL